jgi:hypothetical protein
MRKRVQREKPKVCLFIKHSVVSIVNLFLSSSKTFSARSPHGKKNTVNHSSSTAPASWKFSWKQPTPPPTKRTHDENPVLVVVRDRYLREVSLPVLTA